MTCELCAAGETRRLRHLGFDFDLCARCSSEVKGLALRPARAWTSIVEIWRTWRARTKDNAVARRQFEVAHTPGHPEQLFVCSVPTPQFAPPKGTSVEGLIDKLCQAVAEGEKVPNSYRIDENGYFVSGLVCPNPRQMAMIHNKPVVTWDDEDRQMAEQLLKRISQPEATRMPGPGRRVCY
jgi:hypothetical protein